MNIFRIYACDSRLIHRRLELLVESTGCAVACGQYHRLQPEEVMAQSNLDERLIDSTDQVRQLEALASDGFSVYLLEVWCRYESGYCPYHQSLSSCVTLQQPSYQR